MLAQHLPPEKVGAGGWSFITLRSDNSPWSRVAGEALIALGWTAGRGNSPGSLFCIPHALEAPSAPHSPHCPSCPGCLQPRARCSVQCSISLLQEALPALLRPTSHCQITQIAPFTPKKWDKCPFPPLKAPTATFPSW